MDMFTVSFRKSTSSTCNCQIVSNINHPVTSITVNTNFITNNSDGLGDLEEQYVLNSLLTATLLPLRCFQYVVHHSCGLNDTVK